MDDWRTPGVLLCRQHGTWLGVALLVLAVLCPAVSLGAPKSNTESTTAVGGQKMTREGILPGDPAPAPKIGKWIQRGSYDRVRPVGKAAKRVTVLEFWADWSPLSRTVLPMHDRMQAGLESKGIRFLAIAEGDQENVQAIVKRLALRHMAVACDDGQTTFRAYLGADDHVREPFVVVVEESADQGHGRVLWKGPAVTDADSGSEGAHASDLSKALARIAAGTYDLAQARQIECAKAAIESAKAAIKRLETRLWSTRDVEQIYAVGREAMDVRWPAECNDSLVNILASASWSVVSGNAARGERLSDGLAMIRAAMRICSKEISPLMHIYARALFENGRIEDAVAAERRAMELPTDQNGFSKQELTEALSRYEAALPGDHGTTTAVKTPAPEPPPAPTPPEATMVAQESLTADQAAADLLAFHNHLRLNYSAYDDISWRLAGEGSSWEKRNAEFVARIRARKDWPVCDLFDLLSEYLTVVHDRHLGISGTFSRGGASQAWYARPTTGVSPFFADVRVRQRGGRMLLTGIPGTASIPSGAVLVGVPVIGSPNTVKPGSVYLFPTLPSGSTNDKEYLLGILAEPSSAPNPVKVTVDARSSGGGTGRQVMTFPVHRGRAFHTATDSDSAWSLSREPVPVLTVWRMNGDGLEGLPQTADTLRDLPTVVLDLRKDCGGSDLWASQWVQRFSRQDYLGYVGSAELRRGETTPLRRWSCMVHAIARPTKGSGAPDPYKGRLFVITGMGCASSGETFANLAGQVQGAVLVGENTGGFVTYGNLDQQYRFPHADITVRFGRSKFAVGKRPVCEAVGMFPDYWLDGDDPIAAVRAYCARKWGTD